MAESKTLAKRRNKSRSRERRKKLITWSVLILLMACIVVLGVMPIRQKSILEESIQSAGHFVFFGFLALAICMAAGLVWPKLKEHRWRQYLVGLGCSVAAGIALEVVQSFIPYRQATLADVISDSWGAVAGSSLLAVVDQSPAKGTAEKWASRLALPALLVALSFGAWPLVSCGRDYLARNAAFPIIVSSGAAWSQRFEWLDQTVSITPTEPPADWPTPPPSTVGHVVINPVNDYPGIGSRESASNWSKFDTLAISVYGLKNTPVDAYLRIHDFAHDSTQEDRFTRRLTIQPGYQEFKIDLREVQSSPRQRLMDMTSIYGVKLFLVKPTRAVEFLSGDWRLEKRAPSRP